MDFGALVLGATALDFSPQPSRSLWRPRHPSARFFSRSRRSLASPTPAFSPSPAKSPSFSISFSACLKESDLVCLFDKNVNAKRVLGYVFDKASLLQYDHLSFGGEPVHVEIEEEAEELTAQNEDYVNGPW